MRRCVESNGEYTLHTVTGQLFTADEFIAWYRTPADGWIPPGGEVTDADNYGGPRVLWPTIARPRAAGNSSPDVSSDPSEEELRAAAGNVEEI